MFKVSLFFGVLLHCMAVHAEGEKPDSLESALESFDELGINWLDTSHAYATDQVQGLTEWMDAFFGDPNYDIERAESILRLQMSNTWDQRYNHKIKFKLRGKIPLPRISKRLNLFFSGDDSNQIASDEDRSNDQAGLMYKAGERKRSRLDLLLGFTISDLTPGIRYRNQARFNQLSSYRFTQKLEYETGKGAYTTSELNLDHSVNDNTLVRWNNRVVYGEDRDGIEWRTDVAYNQRRQLPERNYQRVLSYFVSVNGTTDPSYTRNYRFGTLYRRQVYRQFLFMELEPSYNFRKDNEDEARKGAWNFILRLEIVLQPSLKRH